MNTVLFFVYSNKYICANRIAGARRFAERGVRGSELNAANISA